MNVSGKNIMSSLVYRREARKAECQALGKGREWELTKIGYEKEAKEEIEEQYWDKKKKSASRGI